MSEAPPPVEPPRSSAIPRGSSLILLAQMGGNAGFFVAVLVLARGLEPGGRGAIAFFIVVATIAARLCRIGVTEATMVLAAQEPQRRPTLLGNLLVFSVVASAIGGLGAAGFVLALGDRHPIQVNGGVIGLLVAGVVTLCLFESGHNYLLGAGQLKARAIVTVLGPWLYATLIVAVWVATGLTVWKAAAVWVLAQLAAAVGAWAPAILAAGLTRPELGLLRGSIRFGVRAWVGSLSTFLNFRTDQLLLGMLASAPVLGVYAVAVNVSEILLYLPEAVALALLPLIARGGSSVTEQTLRSFRLLSLISLGAIAVAAVTAPFLIPVVFGEDYSGAIGPFLTLLPGAVGYGAMRVFSNALVASSAPGLSSVGPLVALALGVGLDLVLIPFYGAEGAGAAASAAFLAGGAASIVAFHRHQPFPWRRLLR